MPKRVQVTIELSESFIRILNAKAHLSNWTRWVTKKGKPPALDAAGILAWLILMEARGGLESDIRKATPPMWQEGGPKLIHTARKVFES